MADMRSDSRSGFVAPDPPGTRRLDLAAGAAPSLPSRDSSPSGMHLRALLNEPLPSMRTLEPPGGPARASQGSGLSAEHRLSGAPLARPDQVPAHIGWQPPLHAAPVKVEAAEPSMGDFASAHAQRLPMSKLLFTKSAAAVQVAVQDMRAFVRTFRNADDLNIASGRAVSSSYNAQEPATRGQLWTNWHIFSTLARALGVPVFPIQPDKVALVLAAHADLPISPVLRDLARVQTAYEPAEVPQVLEALNLAAKATRHLWPDVPCFVRSADSYDATAALIAHVDEPLPAPIQRPVDSFYSRPAQPAARLHRPPHPPPRDSFTSRPLLTHVPPAPPLPAFLTPPPDQFIQPAHGEDKQTDLSLRSLCEDLPGLLNDMQKEPDDLATFEIAQDRFQTTVNTPEYASRVARLHHTAVIYTHVTALLHFPTYPITSRKLAVFALAMTPGPLGAALDVAVPAMQSERQCPRAPKGKTLEDILQDLTVVRNVTRGALPDEEKTEWLRWWKEITDDWMGKGKKGRGKGKGKMRRDDERPIPPAAKRVKRSASPESDNSVASSSRLPGKKGRQPRPRISATEPSSRAGSPAVRVGKGAKKGSASASRTRAPSPVVYPRFVPDHKGVLPDDRREPPLPPIMDSPWFVPKKKKVRGGSVEGSVAGSGAGGEGAEGGEESAEEGTGDEDEQAKVLGRSVALHRPRRGGLDMKPFDVSLLWD